MRERGSLAGVAAVHGEHLRELDARTHPEDGRGVAPVEDDGSVGVAVVLHARGGPPVGAGGLQLLRGDAEGLRAGTTAVRVVARLEVERERGRQEGGQLGLRHDVLAGLLVLFEGVVPEDPDESRGGGAVGAQGVDGGLDGLSDRLVLLTAACHR